MVGYVIGYFGKWYLGILIWMINDVNWGCFWDSMNYVVLSLNGYDIYFCFEFKIFIWDLMIKLCFFDVEKGEFLCYGWVVVFFDI